MPLPKPKKDESEEDFLNRCMADSVMNDEYPDKSQRYAICNSIWEKKEKKEMDAQTEERKAIGSHKTVTSDKAWNGPKAEANLKNDEKAVYYRKAFAWIDPEGDADTKAAYKFIHHEVSSDGTIGAANIRGCQAAIAVLNGARGGTKIPPEDRKGVWNHVAKHIRDAEGEPAELKSDEEIEKELRTKTFKYCVCTENCGYYEEKKAGEPCADIKCPDCGAPLKGSNKKPGEESKAKEQDNIEFRTIATEFRASAEEDGKQILSGHSALFNRWSENLGGFREKILPGAFKDSIKQDDIRALYNHDPNYVLGRSKKSKTLRLEEDDKGLLMEVEPPGTQWANDLMVSVDRGDISQQSFAFQVLEDGEEWKYPKDKPAERTLSKVKLFDVSVVTFPAYPKTDISVALRSLENHKPKPQPLEADADREPPERQADARSDLADLREREIKQRLLKTGVLRK